MRQKLLLLILVFMTTISANLLSQCPINDPADPCEQPFIQPPGGYVPGIFVGLHECTDEVEALLSDPSGPLYFFGVDVDGCVIQPINPAGILCFDYSTAVPNCDGFVTISIHAIDDEGFSEINGPFSVTAFIQDFTDPTLIAPPGLGDPVITINDCGYGGGLVNADFLAAFTYDPIGGTLTYTSPTDASVTDLTFVVPTATDNCSSPVTITFDITNANVADGDPDCSRRIRARFRAEDECGNITSGDGGVNPGPGQNMIFFIEIEDQDDPVMADPADVAFTTSGGFGCPGPPDPVLAIDVIPDITLAILPATVASGAAITFDGMAAGTTPTPTDDCVTPPSLQVVSVVENNANQPCAYSITVTYRSEDDCGNFVEQDQTFSVMDDSAPTIVALDQSIIILCTDSPIPNGHPEMDPTINPATMVTDDCGFANVIAGTTANWPAGPAAGSASGWYYFDGPLSTCVLGYRVFTRYWWLVDNCGNVSAFESQPIDVEDLIPPVFNDPADENLLTSTGADCPAVATTTLAVGEVVSGSSFDVAGQTFTAPTEVAHPAAGVGEYSDQCYPPAILSVASIVVDDAALPCTRVITINWEVMDSCGNVTPQDQVFSITDDDPAVFDQVAGAMDAPLSLTDPNGACPTDFTAGDFAYDAANDELEITDPISGTVFTFPAPTSSDNCTDPTNQSISGVAFNITVGPSCTVEAIVTWTADDGCGLNPPALYDQVITITDDALPTPNIAAGALDATAEGCPLTADPSHFIYDDVLDVLTYDDGINPPTVLPSPQVADFDENCAVDNIYLVSVTKGPLPTPPCEVDFTLEWEAEDVCGNRTAPPYVQIITVEDNTAPVFTLTPPSTATLDCYPEDSLYLYLVFALDNCPGIGVDITVTDVVTVNGAGCSGDPIIIERTYTATDECGNSSDYTHTLTVVDDVDPIFAVTPADTTYTCLADVPAADPTDVTAINGVDCADNAEVIVIVVETDNGGTGCAADPLIITRTYTATDECNNSADFVHTITVVDDVDPTIDTPAADMTVECDGAGNAADLAAWLAANGGAVASDNCSTPTWSNALTATVFGCGGTVCWTYEFTATDACGNTATTTANFCTEDTTDPTWTTAPADGTAECDGNGNSAEFDAWLTSFAGAVADDVCSGVTLSYTYLSFVAGNCPGTGVYTYEITATDDCLNSISETVTYTITDVTEPVITCPVDVTVDCEDDTSPTGTGWATATDVCNAAVDVTYNDVVTPGICAGSYVIERTWSAVDACGNDSDCVQTITVTDTEAPVMTNAPLQFDEEYLTDPYGPCHSDITFSSFSQVSPGCFQFYFSGGGNFYDFEGPCIEDNCSVASASAVATINTDDPCLRTFTVVWTISDDCGNTYDYTQAITFHDQAVPVWSTQDPLLIDADCSDDIDAIVAANVPTAVDNCDAVVTEVADYEIPGTCPQNYTRVVEYEVADLCGNTSSDILEVRISVTDQTAPVIAPLPADLDLECDGTGNAVAIAAWLAANGGAGATDDCGTVSWSYTLASQTAGPCNGTGTWVYEFTATDECGNSWTEAASVNIEDSTDPVITCPVDATVDCEDDTSPTGTGWATATDVCNGNPAVTYVDLVTPGACAGNYTITRTWTAEDACGNTSDCVQTITVVDTEAPVIVGAPATFKETYLTDPYGPCPADFGLPFTGPVPGTNCYQVVFAAGGNFYDFDGPCIEDNCSTASASAVTTITVDNPCTKGFTVEWTIEDDCGNSTTLTQLFLFHDQAVPVWSTQDPLLIDADCSDDIDAIVAANVPTAVDNCDAVVTEVADYEIPGTCPQNYTRVVEYEVADLCGNVSSDILEVRISVTDQTAPVIAPLPADLDLECNGAGNAVAIAAWLAANGGAGATDDCGAVSWSYTLASQTAGPCNGTGTWVYEFTATDECGNSWTEAASVNIEDSTDPVITCPVDVTVDCEGDTSPNGTGFATATDVCNGNPAVTYADVITPGNCAGNYTITRTWTAEDACGNTSDCVQTITVVDTEAPVVTSSPLALDDEYLTDPYGPCHSDIWFAAAILIGGTDCYQVFFTDGQGTFWDFDGPCIEDNCSALDLARVDVDTLADDDCVKAFLITWTIADECGNTNGTLTQTITFHDAATPVWAAPNPIIIDADCTDDIDAIVAANIPAAVDNCNATVTEVSDTDIPGSCPANYTRVVTYSVVDDCGNTQAALAEVRINVSDQTGPTFTALPTDLTLDCDGLGHAAALAGWLATNGGATATDDCGTVTWTHNLISQTVGPCNGTGIWTYEFIATDDCGNSSVETADFILTDNTAPVIDCPDDITLECGTPTDPSVTGTATASDVCNSNPAITYVDDVVFDGCDGNYVITRTWTATDACGNTAECDQLITVQDTQVPVFTSLPPSYEEVLLNDPDGPCPTDITFYISQIINDCGTVLFSGAGSNGITDYFTFEGPCATDACTGVTLDVDVTNVSINDCGAAFTITWTATDDCNNFTIYTHTVAFYDEGEPVWTSPNPLLVTADCTDNIDDVIAANIPTAADNCSVNVVEVNRYTIAGTCPQEYTQVVEYEVSDGCLNTNGTLAEVRISVEDNDGPVWGPAPANASVSCDGAGNVAALNAWLASNGGGSATDNCGTVTYSFNLLNQTFGCGPTSVRTYEFIATDDCGNSTVATATFSITDSTAPTITTPASNMTVQCSAANNPTQLTAWLLNHGGAVANDLCGTVTWTWTLLSTTPGCGSTSTRVYRFTATDECGNSATTTANFITVDTTPPVLSGVPASTTVVCIASIPAAPTVTATDDCAGSVAVTFNQTITNINSGGVVRIIVRTWTANDGCGNVTTGTQTIDVIDPIPPTVTNCPANIGPIVSITGACVPVFWTPPTFSDNCTFSVSSTHSPGFCFPVGVTTVVYTATDEGGNKTTCSFTVTITEYCKPPATGTTHFIYKFVYNGLENTSGDNGGYADFTSINTTVNAGQVLVVSLIPRNDAGNFNVQGFWRIWIDYNADGDWNDLGELVLQQSGVGPLVGQFVVPNPFMNQFGTKRLRVYFHNQLFMNPCDWHLGQGEAEDYTITVNPAVTKPGPSKDELDVVENVEIIENPVEITADPTFGFVAEKANDLVDLTWITNTEFKNDHFVIERSIDGIEFTNLMTVQSTKKGESVIYYKTKDKRPAKGASYYRLKQVYTDGTFQYSETRKVFFGLDANAIELFPNPTSDYVYLNLGEYAGKSCSISIFNGLSQAVFQSEVVEISEEPVRVDLTNITGGVYNVVITMDGEQVNKTFVLQK